MSVARRTGDPGNADRLFSLIVRSRGRCEFPGCSSQGPFDTAHNIPRECSGTRCVEDNAWCLCRSHHRLVDKHWHEKRALTLSTIGEARYEELRALSEGYKHLPTTSATFWKDEVARLSARCAELDIDTRRTA